MAWPTSPTNGATTTVNGILYVYNSTSGSWSPTASSATDFNVGNITATGNLSSSNYSDSGNLTVGGNLSVGGINTQISSSNTNLAGNLTVGSNLVVNGANTFISSSNATVTGNLNIVTGNLNLTGLGQRITGDFSNGTIASRVIFQTTTANSNTALSVIPNGTSVIGAFQAYGNSDPTNSSSLDLASTFSINSILQFSIPYLSNKQKTDTLLPHLPF